MSWLDINGYKSYDVYDFWTSSLGIKAKKLFNKNKLFASPLVGSIQILDSFMPHTRYLFANKKNRFPMADGQLASSFYELLFFYKRKTNLINGFRTSGIFIKKATNTQHGFGWGNPYHWVTAFFEYPGNSPLITVTPYCFDAFLSAFEIIKMENIQKH